MIKRVLTPLASVLAVLLLAPSVGAAYELEGLGMSFERSDESLETRAGAHPFAMKTSLQVGRVEVGGKVLPDGETRDLTVDLPPGFIADPAATPRCTAAEFADFNYELGIPSCPDSSAIGISEVNAEFEAVAPGVTPEFHVPVYNLVPQPGAVAKFGFAVLGVPVTIEGAIRESYPNNAYAKLTNIPQSVLFYGAELTLWGNPADPVHDPVRGSCVDAQSGGELSSLGQCPVDISEAGFLTAPRSCTGQLSTRFDATAWNSGARAAGTALTPGMSDCQALGFSPEVESRLTTERASSASGLEFDLAIPDAGITSPTTRAGSEMKEITVALPEGVTLNPSQAEGLETCSESQLAREGAAFEPGEGCPQASKVGNVSVATPLLNGATLGGAVYVAEPHDNPAGTLVAIYVVIRNPDLGIVVKQTGKVEPDSRTGQLVTTFDKVPQLPISDITLRLRSGARSPLITPERCGEHVTRATFVPWADPDEEIVRTSIAEIDSGPGGGSCPTGSEPPFDPGFAAGTINNHAGSFSPFFMRLTRRDGDQDITRFDADLPRGVLASLAGVERCGDAAIDAADDKTGIAERQSPSCPAGSQIGSVLAGAGVGSELTYVPGKLYLAGPYNGDPLSVAAIIPAVAGPFDVGTVVVRQALDVNPITAQVEVDSDSSDAIPHILEGIPLKVRDIRVSVDRENFTLNPTSCAPMASLAQIWGGGSDLFSGGDDSVVDRGARFQAASCASLGFSPRLAIRLFGGARRGSFPALRAVVAPPPGQANFFRAAVILPSSSFIEQGHFGNICTRVQFAAGAGHGTQCPPRSRYGFARAWSPLLDGPAQGPVYLRSSDNELPDLVVALRGPDSARVNVELSARIDSVGQRLRATFTGIPDVPVSRFVLGMQGGKKGLIVNSRHLCLKPRRNRATANLRGQNGRVHRTKPRVVSMTCVKRRQAARRKAKRVAARKARAVVRVRRARG